MVFAVCLVLVVIGKSYHFDSDNEDLGLTHNKNLEA
jgi:hypothetical protein